MMLVYIVGAAILLLILWLASGIRQIGAVSTGTPIEQRPNEALLLIDLQTIFWNHGPYSEAEKTPVSTAISAEAEAAQSQGHPIIAIRQEWSIPSTKAVAKLAMKGQAIAGTDGTELAPPFASLPQHMIVKRVQDAFETGELDALLARLNVGTLRLVGLDFNYCIQKTALAARNRGYDVTVVTPATLASTPTDAAKQKMSAAGVTLA